MFSFLLSAIISDNNSVPNLESDEFNELFKNDPNGVLLDVRTPEENREVRIPNSILINIMDPNFQNEIEKLDKSKSYYVYCRSGNRSFHAGNAMLKLGFTKVFNLAPGMFGWTGDKESDK